jgi:hypothetical protein
LATPLGTTHIDLSNRPSMAGSKDSSEVSTSNIITPTWETLPAEEQLLFEERQEQLIQEAKAKFLTSFKVDRNNKVVRHRATDPASFRPTPDIPNVSNTNELQSGYVSGQSARESFEEDYMNPRSSQQHFPSHYAMHQPINSGSKAQESFPAPPRRPERNDQTYEPYRANGNAPRNSNQWGERQHANIQPTPPMFDQRVGGLAPAAIDIVREEIAGRSEISSE